MLYFERFVIKLCTYYIWLFGENKIIKMQILLISILSFIAAIQASNIVEIQVKTSNELNADMTFGHLDLVICGDPQCCLIENLDSKYDDFQLDSLDSFTHGDLQGCDQFNLPNDYNGKKYFSNTIDCKELILYQPFFVCLPRLF